MNGHIIYQLEHFENFSIFCFYLIIVPKDAPESTYYLNFYGGGGGGGGGVYFKTPKPVAKSYWRDGHTRIYLLLNLKS